MDFIKIQHYHYLKYAHLISVENKLTTNSGLIGTKYTYVKPLRYKFP